MHTINGDLADVLEIESELSEEAEITGTASETGELSGSLSGESELTGELTIPPDYPVYDGANEITPLAHSATTLPTNGCRMDRDIVVKPVPYYETSNTSGETVYIAGE